MESNKTTSWPTNSNGIPFRLAICGLGKFGGKEMGFASDRMSNHSSDLF
jgi:glutamine synthetase adenylyltransferase